MLPHANRGIRVGPVLNRRAQLQAVGLSGGTGGGDAVFPAELAIEGEVLIAGSMADCGDGFVGVLQHLAGVREPQFADGVAEALAG